jgi:flavin reductase
MLPLRQTAVDPQIFREAMSRFAAGVTIITTSGVAGKAGLTATAFASVSDTPPTVLVCLNAAGTSAARIRANGVFGVNVLASGQAALADHFAGRSGVKGEARFQQGDWQPGVAQVPLLEGALVRCVARVLDFKPVASHLVLFGEVVSVALQEAGQEAGEGAGPGLVYARRSYHAL